MTCSIEVQRHSVTCRERESSPAYDSFALAGAVLVDGRAHRFAHPAFAINERMGPQGFHVDPIVDEGHVESPRIGLVLRAWDVDENERWVRRREDFGAYTAKIAELMGYTAWVDLPDASPFDRQSETVDIVFRGSDPLGYSSWNYSLRMISYTYLQLLFDGSPPGRGCTRSRYQLGACGLGWSLARGYHDLHDHSGRGHPRPAERLPQRDDSGSGHRPTPSVSPSRPRSRHRRTARGSLSRGSIRSSNKQ